MSRGGKKKKREATLEAKIRRIQRRKNKQEAENIIREMGIQVEWQHPQQDPTAEASIHNTETA